MTDERRLRPSNRRGGRKHERRIVDIEAETREDVCLAVAADFLRLHSRTLLARIDEGLIEAQQDKGKWFVSVASLRIYFERRLAS